MEKNEIEKIIRDYFGNAKVAFDVCMMAGIASVSIEYTDFKPKNVVIKELIDLVPNIDINTIDRNYSNEALTKEMRMMYGSELRIWVEDEPGKLRLVDFGLYLEERLKNRSFE